jgi:hypothetical protein
MGRLVEPGVELTAAKGHEFRAYADRTAKYVPGEIIAAYVSIGGILKSVNAADPLRLPVGWMVFALCLVVTPVYLNLFNDKKRPNRSHLAVSTVAFAVWGYALGGPFEYAGIYKSWLGSVLLVVFTVLSGLLEPKRKTRS